MKKVLFVCLGNICRSPMAEAIFAHLVKKEGLDNLISWDSAGTSQYHVGQNADIRTIKCLQKKNIDIHHKARTLTEEDIENFDYILAMDNSNYENIQYMAENMGHSADACIEKIRNFDTMATGEDVPDPYHDAEEGFEKVYVMLYRSCKKLIEKIKQEL